VGHGYRVPRRRVPAPAVSAITAAGDDPFLQYVLRLFGKRATRAGAWLGRYPVPISTDLKVRVNGARVKHRLGQNSLNIYDKAYDELGAVLRPEITINRPEIYRVFRTKNNDPDGKKAWRTMRRGTVDLGRRAQVCQKALDVYCSALAEVDDSSTWAEMLAALEKRVRHDGRSYRGLHPFEPKDLVLLRAVNRGEFAINGLRNRDLQAVLYTQLPSNPAEQRRRSADQATPRAWHTAPDPSHAPLPRHPTGPQNTQCNPDGTAANCGEDPCCRLEICAPREHSGLL
jgi:hypothetical protein